MRTAGSVLCIVGGVLGLLAALTTGLFGSFVGAIEDDPRIAEQADIFLTVGVISSFAVIVTGSVGLKVRHAIPGALVLVFSCIGAIGGGMIVAVIMFLCMAGGILLILGRKE